ncbi:MAG: glycine zipper 2TM domain-containing protein [Phenylobacterium sp.]|uniref:glycine zipper 2TM domain-containing protein n=1 Tax=Phenylobacterium sp. TaxID=1871053 RepID=UPI002732AD11|nr:glycine zipper 2TM domain-containing protein [Phenylobacterium sp.]MDP3175966.1 glycine zipper 2TM domain-containing protein [Phenylobacterium sp.]
MKRILVFSAVAAISASTLAAPDFAAAQSQRNYGSSDPCRDQQRRQANTGTLTGGVLGALVGGSVAGNGAKTEGAILGGAVGAVAGHQIAKRNFKCGNYPSRVSQRRNCRWVQEYYGGRNHSFEVCRQRDGVWRPSGRG